ncbi:MAG: 2-hydroxyacyl-CoA dehydratase [Deltaproteobacteria bacterium]|nr:2-hydroxyacyl-CoA dehydratase [Deltaproteobacteria bacterium]MBW2136519.1 2-hydroxyacyl-CoA dehydratase [Deltaproteobacteria bacterium]
MSYTLTTWNDFKNYQSTCYRNYLYASDGLRCMGSTWSVLAPLKGLGEDVHLIGGEPHAASTAGTFPDEGRKDILAAETAGLGFHSCSYLKLFVGEVVRNKIAITDRTIKEGYPKPDLIWTTHLCSQHSKWYQEVSRRLGGIPIYAIDMIGGGKAEKDPRVVKYVCDQVEEGIWWLERVTGREFSDKLFIRAARNEIKVLVLWGNICALNKHAPAPLDERRLIALFPPAMVDRTTDETVRMYGALFDEVKRMVEAGQSVVSDQRYRIVYFGLAHTYGHPEIARILRDVGAEIVASIYTFGTAGNFTGFVNGKWSWEPIDPEWVDQLDLSTRRDAIRALVKIALGWPTWQGVRSYWALEQMAAAMVEEYRADGLLLAPSRSCETDFRNGYIALQRLFRDKIPTVEYDTDQVDVRKMDLPGSQRKTELLVRLMEARRKGRA